MSTVLLAPGVELAVTGKPFGETPAMEVDNLRRRVARKARAAVIVLVILAAAAVGIVWHLGQPFWGNWPHVNATVVTQREYVAKYTDCDLGLSSVIDGQQHRNHVSIGNPCNRAPAIGSVVQMTYSPEDHGWVSLPRYQSSPAMLLFLAGVWLGLPLAGWSLLTALAVRRLRRVSQLGTGPWHDVTGLVKSASISGGVLALDLSVAGAPDVGMRFGTRGISFFPVPTAGSTLTLRMAGDGSGRILVAIPGHWGESLGLLWAVPVRQNSN